MRPIALDARQDAIRRLSTDPFDLLVIGGGITGVGAAQDAAARGLRVALVERGDFAIGTSSRSSKLIHGGLRYLAQGDFRVTYESCAERALLLEIAPHLVKSLTFLIPIYRWSHGLQIVTGLWLYDIISQLKNSKFHKRVNVEKARALAPQIATNNLICGYLYHDCQTNDARLVMEVSKSASSYGAIFANYLQVDGLIKENEKIVGARAKDLISNQEIEIRAKVVVNATGVWMDGLRRIDDPQAARKVRPAKGVHILIDRNRIPTNSAMLFESGAQDGRSLFFIPWYEGTIIGTTDTDYQGEIDSPRASAEDIKYILDAVNKTFPTAHLDVGDILSSYAGLRPLIDEGGKSTKDISREHKIFESESGLISIAGGKLTTYRRMAQHLVDYVIPRLKARGFNGRINPSKTDQIYLSGFEKGLSLQTLLDEITARALRAGLDAIIAAHLVDDYGVNARLILDLVEARRSLGNRLSPELPFIHAEVIYATRCEQATRLDDLLVRRTRLAFLSRDQGAAVALQVARLMGEELNWSEADINTEIARYQESSMRQYLPV